MDTHMAIRGPWQRQMFAEYYDMFDLVKPPPLLSLAAQVCSRDRACDVVML